MIKKVCVVLSIVLLVLVAACAQQPSTAGTIASQCADKEALPNIDDIGIDAGIGAAAGALIGEANTTAPKTPAKAATNATPPVTKPADTAAAKPADSQAITKTFNEGDLVSFPNLKATDPDGDKITYTFSAPLDKDGEWQTKAGDAGSYDVTITASDGTSSVSQKVKLVIKKANSAPVISGLDVISVKEGENVALGQEVVDPDGDQITVTISGWMNSTLRSTGFSDAGDHEVVVTATDGKLTTKKTVLVKVANFNHAPVISDLSPVTVMEGDNVTVVPQTTDADGDKISYTYDKQLDASGRWQTKAGDAGSYDVKVTASDGTASDSTTVKITVKKKNSPPVITDLSDLTVNEGDTVKLQPTVTDPDGDKVVLVYSGWMTTSTRTTTYGDAGSYEVTLTASDALGNTAKKTVKVTVKEVNRAPVFDPNAFG